MQTSRFNKERKLRKSLYIFSGIRPGHSGVGNLMLSLQHEASLNDNYKVQFIFGKNGGPDVRKALLKINIKLLVKEVWHRMRGYVLTRMSLFVPRIMNKEEVILVSPPTLGLEFCRKFIERRKKITWIYVVDAGFFCIRSANHLSGEDTACLRCIGGQWENVFLHSCYPFPGRHSGPTGFCNFLSFLKKEVIKKKVGFMVQNDTNVQLIKRHFGVGTIVSKVGLWADFDGIDEYVKINEKVDSTLVDQKYDVVFHGSFGETKGAIWAIRLAEKCPQYSFLFPCDQSRTRELEIKIPKNCFFKELNWNTGLKAHVISARLIICPSLWSAPIEAALIKSIAFGRKTAVVNEPTAYSSEISDDIVLKLPNDINNAAKALENYFKIAAVVSEEKKEKWLSQFVSENKCGLKRILRVVYSGEW